jgi:hypothetical protein
METPSAGANRWEAGSKRELLMNKSPTNPPGYGPLGTPDGGDDRGQRVADGRECFQAAIQYRALGWSVLAVCPPDHAGVGKTHGQKCGSPGKAPWGPWKEFQDRLPTESELQEKWKCNPTFNVGIALGPVSGLIRVDVDGPAGEKRLQEISAGDLPDTLEFTSGRQNGGRGLLYSVPPGASLRTTTEKPGEKQELRFQAKGSQTVLPPSRHLSGCRYSWKPGHGPDEIKPALAPSWLIAQLSASATTGRSSNGVPRQVGNRIPEGGRNDNLTSLAGSMRRRGMAEEAMEAALQVENQQRCDPPLAEAEVSAIAKSVARYAPGESTQAHTAYHIILDYFRQKYRPVFRRGTTIYSDALRREVKQNEACTAPGIELLGLLATAVDAPRYPNNGDVRRDGLPRFFRTWAPSSWVDMLDGLPDEEQAEEVSMSAQEEFGDHVAGALLTFKSFGHDRKGEDKTHVENRSLIDWCQLWAREGRWQSVRGLCLWIRRGEDGRLCVALNARLFGQIGYRQLTGMTQDRFAELAERYDVGRRLPRGQKAGGSRAVELLAEFLDDLLSQPGDALPGPLQTGSSNGPGNFGREICRCNWLVDEDLSPMSRLSPTPQTRARVRVRAGVCLTGI